MSTPNIETPTERRSIRPFLIGGGIALLVVVLGILFLNDPRTNNYAVPSGSSVFVLAIAAFIAGIFSFLSPCTLPILPAYFAFTFQAQRERIVVMTVAFFLGLATTVVLLGATATAISQFLFDYLRELTIIGGIVIIVFGVMSMFGKGFSGMQLLNRPTASVAGSYVYGATFALGWTACVGPIYGALLTMLATQGIAVVQGAILAFIYALGLGMPLIIISTFFSRLGRGSTFWQVLRGRSFTLNLGVTSLELHTTSFASGLLLILMGILLATNQLAVLSEWMQSTPMAQWALNIEQSIEQIFFRR